MITTTPRGAATANLQAALVPAASGPVELRAGSGDDGRLGAFPRALQRSVDEPGLAPAKLGRAVAARSARREGPADVSMVAPVAAGEDADTLLTELNARRALRTKITSEGPSPTPSADGLEPRVVASRPLKPVPGGGVLPPADGDGAVLPPPFHDQPGAPMPRDTAAEAEPAPATRRSAPPVTTAPLRGLSATVPAAGSKLPPGGPQPAVPRPPSNTGKGALQPVPPPGDVVAPPAVGDEVLSTPPFHDRPGAPTPRDSGTEAAQAVAGPTETRTPDFGVGLDAAPRFSPSAETLGAAGNRTATELTAGPQTRGQPGAAVAPAATNTAAPATPWPGPAQATLAGIVAPAVPAADDEWVRPANEAGSTPFTPSLPMGQALAPAGMSAAAATGAPADARLMAAPGSADFSSQLGAQLTTFVREGVQHARLHLHPAELGPVTVRIQIDGQAAQVHMAAEHALTRQALEQSMPMLAGSLREAGLTLSGGGVFEQPRQRDRGDAPGQPGAGPASTPGGDRGPETPLRTAAGAPARRGVVDLVA